MRGITTMHYRQAFARRFAGLDCAVAPFIPTVNAERINPKLLKDVLPENNADLPLIPQLISNHADDFIRMCDALRDLGYEEVNWNLGCPHKPIRNRKRGSGLLPYPDTVDRLLDQICQGSPIRVSVKVRLGISNPSDLMALIPVLNNHPVSEVIVHPRTAEQMYTGSADLDAFEEAYAALTRPVCYNGDIGTRSTFRTIQTRFPEIHRFMLGRGLLADPFLCEEIKRCGEQGRDDATSPDLDPLPRLKERHCDGDQVERIAAFHDDLLARYESALRGDHPVLGKMKEFWKYQSLHLSNGHDMFKKLKKTRHLHSYKAIVSEFLEEASWNPPV